jgi:hypothetical protein
MSLSLRQTNDLHAIQCAFFDCFGQPESAAARFSMQINEMRAEPHQMRISFGLWHHAPMSSSKSHTYLATL